MVENIINGINYYVNNMPFLAYIFVFLGGVVFGLAPCAMAVIPLTIGFVGGYSGGNVKRAFFYSLCFVFGFAITLTFLGVTAAVFGKYMGHIGSYWYVILALIAIAMGLSLLDIFNFNFSFFQIRTPKQGAFYAFVLGLGFGIISAPCSTPILIILLALVASKGKIFYGGSLLLTYALGQSLLILLAGTFTGLVDKIARSRGLSSFSVFIKKFSGALIILVGIYIFLKYI